MSKYITPPDSLDLLLDAMCNIFGAILLTAIVLGGVSAGKKLLDPAGKVSADEFRTARMKNAALRTELENIQLESALLRTMMPPETAPDNAVSELQNRYSAAARQANLLADELEVLQNENNLLRHKQTLLRNALQADSCEKLQKLRDQLQNALNRLPEQEIRLPHLAGAHDRQPWRLLVTAEKVLLIGSNQHLRSAAGEVNDVAIQRFRAHGHTFYRILPRPERGFKLNGMLQIPPEILPRESQQWFIELLVEPDAVSQAARLLEMLRQEKRLYFWRIVPTSGAMLRTAERSSYDAQI